MPSGLFVVSGPSGAGKGTLLALVMQRFEKVWLSVSATTRPPRNGEVNGVQYFFLSNDEFDTLVAVDGLLEWATVHGERYGTIRGEVEDRLQQGIDVILEIDPLGALQIQAKMPQAVLVFVMPPSFEILERRLRGRGTDNEASIQRRMTDASKWMAYRDHYDALIVNDDLSSAADELYQLILKKTRNEEPDVFNATTCG